MAEENVFKDAGKRGGKARAKSLPAERRKQIAAEAARRRWGGPLRKATHGSEDHPLIIGDMKIPCYVLEDGMRVLSQAGLTDALGMARGGSMIAGMNRLQLFVSRKKISPYISKDLVERISKPIPFMTPSGVRAHGFEATLLADVCEAVLKAREDDALQTQQQGIAAKCEVLVRGFARVGIIALVDEATGYQRDRAKDALAQILEAFIAKELQPWVRTFPTEFYQEMFRLRGMKFPTETPQKPRYFGVLTNDVIYDRLAPGVLEELKKVNPRDEATGRRKRKHFQWLTNNIGYPKLREHLGAVIATMKLSGDWHDFKTKLDKFYPRIGKPTQLTFDYEQEEADDTGKGL